MDMKSFKEYSMRSVGLSRPGTSKKVFPVLTRKGSDSNIGLQRGDVPLQKAMNDAGKVVRVRLTPTQIKQYITILKKKYKEYGGKDKDLLNSFTERLEQKIMDEGKKLDENFRTLATKGMGTETKANAKVGQELDFYEPKKGDKFLGKIIKTKYGPAGFYQILGLDRQTKGKVFTFKYYDKDKAKNLLKNESKKLVEKGTSPSRYIEILNRLREETEYQKFFMSALKKFGVKSPAELDGEKEKKFYDYVDKNWKAKNEPKEVGEKHKPKQNGKTLTGKPKDKIDVNPQTSDIRAGKY